MSVFKTKLRNVLLFIVMLIASALLAQYLSGRQLSYKGLVGSANELYVDLVTYIYHDDTVKNAQTNEVVVNPISLQILKQHHRPQIDTTRCVDVSLGEVKYTQQGDIYSWTDSEGIAHFSDKKPSLNATPYNTGFVDTLDYFELTLSTPNLPASFKQALRVKLNAVFKVYGQIIGVDSLRKVKLDLRVLATQTDYENAVRRRGGDPTNTQGIYFNSSNTAFINYNNEQSAMRTAVHEAVHAINKAVLGSTPRWLDEGLAEYFEHTNNTMQTVSVEPSTTWLKNHTLSTSILTLNELLNQQDNWQRGESTKLYASSWAGVYFLMDSKQGKGFLKSIMLEQQKSPCVQLTPLQLQSALAAHFPDLNNDYMQWLKIPFRAHHF